MSKQDITLKDVAGLLTEKAVWQMIADLTDASTGNIEGINPKDIIINDDGHFTFAASKNDCVESMAFASPEHKDGIMAEASEVWTIGAMAFYAIMSVNVFEGKGGTTQREETEVPRISSRHASYELSQVIYKCLNYSPTSRPSKSELHEKAIGALKKDYKPRKRLVNSSGKSYASSLVSFWPEEMTEVLLLLLMMVFSLGISAQTKTEIPAEMTKLVGECVSLRTATNKASVQRSLQRDTKWTMMDEIDIDRNGECTTKDKVDMFGLNAIGFKVLKLHNGITNSGGRFRDGRDPRYKYSFIEITVKKGHTVNYDITGREGSQLFAIVPHKADAQFTLTITKGSRKIGNVVKNDGVCYISVKSYIRKSDSFRLSLSNQSGKNMSFVIINYNSRDGK